VKRRPDPNQILIDWTTPAPVTRVEDASDRKAEGSIGATCATTQANPSSSSSPPPPLLVQVLPWDFSTSFPQPSDAAIEAGTIADEDCTPEGIKLIHAEHAREAAATLCAWDAVRDARRRGVDPATGKPPRSHATREKLRRFFDEEPGRLERHVANLMAVYEDVFGADAAAAFNKAIRARHAGIEVRAQTLKRLSPSPAPTPEPEPEPEQQPTRSMPPKRLSSAMPVPKPLHHAVMKGVFGRDEKGKPIRPKPDEVRAITENHAEKIIERLGAANEVEIRSRLDSYAEDFGERPARQLEAYVRRQAAERGRMDQGSFGQSRGPCSFT
jgi:hypothetical protein